MRIVAAGLNFQSAPLDVRERAVIEHERAPVVLRYLVGHAGLSAAAVLSTCNRTEFYVVAPTDELASQVAPRLAKYLGVPQAKSDAIVACYDHDAVRHMFRVAGGLESMVVGESQVQGQLKRAHRMALDAGCLDARLDFVLRRALSVGKKVRSTTELGSRPAGLAQLALEVIAARHPQGSVPHLVVIGSGHTATDVSCGAADWGARVTVAARSATGLQLAAKVGGNSAEIGAIASLDDVDVIVSCTSSPHAVLDHATVSELQGHRAGAPLLVVDLAVPRDVEPSVTEIAGVELLDVDSLGGYAGTELNTSAVADAEAIVESEVENVVRMFEHQDAVGDGVSAITQWAERTRAGEVQRTVSRMGRLSAHDRELVETMTKSLVRKLLHNPITALNDSGDDPHMALAIRHAFDVTQTSNAE